MSGILSAQSIVVVAAGNALQIVSSLPRGSGAAIKNIGALDVGHFLPGPDDCWLLFGKTSNVPDIGAGAAVFPNAYLLLSGDSITLPGDIDTIYATAARTRTTLTILTGIRQ